MKPASIAAAVCVSLLAALVFAGPADGQTEPVRIEGPEQARLDLNLPDAGLPPAVGVRNYQVFRATRSRPDLADGKGWTYNHHVDMACWNRRLYVTWSSAEKDEDTWPWRELYSTSTDGMTWSAPAELFPQGVSMPLRMYFFLAPNGRMLALAGLRRGEVTLQETNKHSLVVREIKSDHGLGPVFALQVRGTGTTNGLPAAFTESADKGFVEACRQLLANRVFLEQHDAEALLGDRLLKWNDSTATNADFQALSFFHRLDGGLVGIAKKRWVIVSPDNGSTWRPPIQPTTLITGTAKVWGQRTSDGRFALVYNPDPVRRFPLAIVTGNDGVTFRDMRVVHGEWPIQRYQGAHKNVGPQYVRGISEWCNDGSWKGEALWTVYSVNKEDIWVSRIPVPVRTEQSKWAAGGFADWNLYSPRWAPVSAAASADGRSELLTLEDRDPYDYARAACLFPESKKTAATFRVMARQTDQGLLEIELVSGSGSHRPVRLRLAENGKIDAVTGTNVIALASYTTNQWLSFRIEADTARGKQTVVLNGTSLLRDVALAETADDLQRLSFRTGAWRPVSDRAQASVLTDAPVPPASFVIANVKIEP